MKDIIEEACLRLVLCEMLNENSENKFISDTMRGIYFNLVGGMFKQFEDKPDSREIDKETLIDHLRMSIASRMEERAERTEEPINEEEWEMERQDRMRKMKMDHWCTCCECNPCDCH